MTDYVKQPISYGPLMEVKDGFAWVPFRIAGRWKWLWYSYAERVYD